MTSISQSLVFVAVFAMVLGFAALTITGTLAILNLLLSMLGMAAIAITLKVVLIPACIISAIVWFLFL